ncbi:MAG TPA: efflux RND transporter permease subunit, partial [Planctomycetaceae bacterium]|nr:efflux RND transporter permease subunit [Planctomycetaceae bacterium]
ETYAFALGGALLLAMTIAPVLCLLLFKNMKPRPDNILVRFMKRGYLRNLRFCLNHRWLVMGVFSLMVLGTIAALPRLGREFIPPLEEGHIFARGIFPVNVSLDQNAERSRLARAIFRRYPEVEVVYSQLGRPEAGTDPIGFYSAEFFVPLKPQEIWPEVVPQTGWRKWISATRRRTKPELIHEINHELSEAFPGVNWNFSQIIRDNVLEVMSGVQGENSVKIIGPDNVELERLGKLVVEAVRNVRGIKDVGLYRIMGQTNLELPIDRKKCALWNVSVADAHNVIQSAIGGKMISQMIEGEKTFDITIRWPKRLRNDESVILDIPVDVTDHRVSQSSTAGMTSTPFSGQSADVAATGFSSAQPSLTGSLFSSTPLLTGISVPRERLRDLVTPLGSDRDGPLDPKGEFVRSGASMIAREMGNRLAAVKFGVRDRDLASAVAEAKEKVKGLIPKGYSTQWSGEFQQMEEGERRLQFIIPLSLALIFMLLYLAFRSLLDTVAVLFNVLQLCLGGVWALFLTGTNFSISAAVGFTSIFGVAIMDGLLLISSFNQLRAQGLPLRQAILDGAEKRVRPVMMTALTAIFGLLPAAVSVKVGAQSQKPLAIVVVGSMVTTLFITRYLMPVLYSFYGHREPPAGTSDLGH